MLYTVLNLDETTLNCGKTIWYIFLTTLETEYYLNDIEADLFKKLNTDTLINTVISTAKNGTGTMYMLPDSNNIL